MENLQQNQNIPQPVADDEIDLIALAKTLWSGRKTVIKSILVCAIIGLTVAFLSPKEYTASTIMVPQTGGNKTGGLSSLAAMAGFNMNMNTSVVTLSPTMYPQVVNSVPFQLELMNSNFTFSDIDHPVTLYEYYTEISKPGILSVLKKYSIGLPGVIFSALKGETTKNDEQPSTGSLISLTAEQNGIRNLLSSSINLEIDNSKGYISLSTNFHEALLSAQVAQKAQQMLQEYIAKFKIEKTSDQLQFIEERYNEKKKEFEKAQENLAIYRDRNKNVSTAMARTEEERLQSEYSIAFNVYNELAKQLEQAKIQVKEDTPIFSILQPVEVPLSRSKPDKKMILIIWLFLGGVFGTGIVFGKQFWGTVKEKWEEEKE